MPALNTLSPWAYGPFELLLHAEMHLRNGEDFDRRIALISFDNAIEVAITTYLSLHPLLRQNRTYGREDVEKWLANYHTKLDFLESEAQQRGVVMPVSKADTVWYHNIRNDQYHGGGANIPQERDLVGIRKAALWAFSFLFDAPSPEEVLEDYIARASDENLLPKREGTADRLIDSEYGTVEVAGKVYYTSEAIHGIDPIAYSELAKELKQRNVAGPEERL